jgi:hypothetical protein
MKQVRMVIAALVFAASVVAQEAPKFVTVPVTLDHNRIVIDVYLPLPDGSSKRVRARVDSGDAELMMSQRIAALFGPVTCDGQICNAIPPREIVIGASKPTVVSGVETTIMKGDVVTGGLKLSFRDIHSARVPGGVPNDVMLPGMSPEINLPSTILRENDVVFDYASRQFTIGQPGSVTFKGKSSTAQINPAGLVQISTQIEGTKYKLALDTGASVSFISSELLSKWHTTHPAWPFMTGAVGAANMFGTPEETERSVLRVPSLQCGTSTLNHVLMASFAPSLLEKFKQRAGVEAVGLLGGDVFRNYRVGIDYAHSTVYLDRASNSASTEISVVGLTLRPEPDGRYTIVALVGSKPAVPEVKAGDALVGVDGAPVSGATMGQVWSLLGGSPGQRRSLTVEREGKRFTVDATVHSFLTTKKQIGHTQKNLQNGHTSK